MGINAKNFNKINKTFFKKSNLIFLHKITSMGCGSLQKI